MVAISAVRGARPALYLLAAPSTLDRLVHAFPRDALVSLDDTVVFVLFYRELSLAFIISRGFSCQLAVKSNPRLGRRPKHQLGFRNDAGNRVTEVIVAPGSMVDAVTSAAPGAAFEADDLCNEPRVIEQLDLPRVDDGEELSINVGFGLAGGFIGDAECPEAFARPLAAIAIAGDFGRVWPEGNV